MWVRRNCICGGPAGQDHAPVVGTSRCLRRSSRVLFVLCIPPLLPALCCRWSNLPTSPSLPPRQCLVHNRFLLGTPPGRSLLVIARARANLGRTLSPPETRRMHSSGEHIVVAPACTLPPPAVPCRPVAINMLRWCARRPRGVSQSAGLVSRSKETSLRSATH